WNGLIDELILWTNRALTATEIGQVYTNGSRGLTPLTYCASANARTTVFFSGDARFSSTGAINSMPYYFSLLSWATNHNALVVDCSGGQPPGYCQVEQMEEWTNQFSTVMGYYGPGTNLYYIG